MPIGAPDMDEADRAEYAAPPTDERAKVMQASLVLLRFESNAAACGSQHAERGAIPPRPVTDQMAIVDRHGIHPLHIGDVPEITTADAGGQALRRLTVSTRDAAADRVWR
jgi:hypothetical protein